MPTTNTFYIYGKNPIEEQLTVRAEKVAKVFVKNTINKALYSDISELCHQNRVPIVSVPEEKLKRLSKGVHHQGFVAELSQIDYLSFFEWLEIHEPASDSVVLLLDGIEDPHNLGAILRSAAAAGMSAIIVPTQNQAPVNATVMKTSAGTAGRIPVIRSHNSTQALKDLKLAGFKIYALSMDEGHDLWNTSLEGPAAFIIGNEGSGISKAMIKQADQTLSIPMMNNVESLNASVSSALISYEWLRQHQS